jgi:hypothetical protein
MFPSPGKDRAKRLSVGRGKESARMSFLVVVSCTVNANVNIVPRGERLFGGQMDVSSATPIITHHSSLITTIGLKLRLIQTTQRSLVGSILRPTSHGKSLPVLGSLQKQISVTDKLVHLCVGF